MSDKRGERMGSEACIPAFDTDIFISYSHIDNEAFGEDQGHWVSDLHQRLKVRLNQLVGVPFQFGATSS